MASNIFNVDLNIDGSVGSALYDTRVLSELELYLNLNFIVSNNAELVKTKIIFDNNIYVNEFEDIKNNFVFKKQTPFFSVKKDVLQIKLYYSNFNTFEYIIPLVFIPPSTLDYFDGAIIQNAQFIDTKENDDLFFVMKNNKNQLFNFRMGTNVNTYKEYITGLSAEEDKITTILSGTLSTMPPTAANILTKFGEYIEVTT